MIAQESLEAMWVVPLSYTIAYAVFDAYCRRHPQGSLSWERDVYPKIKEAVEVAFPRLRPWEFMEAGFLLLQLDVLQTEESYRVEDLNVGSVASKLTR